jgi:flagellar export protein FliJ
MPFRFKLDAVLRFRESVERTEEAILRRLVGEIADVELEIKQVDLKQIQLREQRERDLSQTVPGVHLTEIAEHEMLLRQVASDLRSQLTQLESKQIKQMAVYQAARQDRQVLSELRDRKQRAHVLDQRRQEQKTLDDLFLSRWGDDK